MSGQRPRWIVTRCAIVGGAALAMIGSVAGYPHVPEGASPLLRTVAIGQPNTSGIIPLTVMVDARTRRVFVTSGDNVVTMLDANSGAELRQVALGNPGDTSVAPLPMAMDVRRGRVFVADNAAVSVLDAHSGRVLRTIPGIAADPQGFAVDEKSGHLIVAAQGGVSVLDTQRGATLHSVLVGQPQSTLFVAVAGRIVLVASKRDHTVTIIDAPTGKLLRRVVIDPDPSPAHDLTSLVLEKRTGRAFVGIAAGKIGVLDLRHGFRVRTVKVAASSGFGGAPFVVAAAEQARQVVVANGLTGVVSLLDGTSGRIVKVVYAGPWPYASAVDERRGRGFVLDMSPRGAVRVLDLQRGAVSRSLYLRGLPYAIAVDEPTGHVFIADSGGTEPFPDPWQGVRHWLPFWPIPVPTGTRAIPPTVTLLDAPRL